MRGKILLVEFLYLRYFSPNNSSKYFSSLGINIRKRKYIINGIVKAKTDPIIITTPGIMMKIQAK